MPGPKTEEAYTWIIHHAHQCPACRDRLWGALMSLRKLTDGLAKVLHKVIDGAVEAGDETLEQPSIGPAGLNGSELNVAGSLLAKAVEVVKQKPEQTVWSAGELFGDDRYDKAEHFARCTTCHARMNQLYQVARMVRSGMTRGNAPEADQAAMTKVCEWFEQLFSRVDQLKKVGVNTTLIHPGNQQSFCN